MAYDFIWPGTLPQMANKNYSEKGGAAILSTPMDVGPPKIRRRGKKPDVLSLSYTMTTAQVEIFRNFVSDSLQEVRRFGLPHPRLQQVTEVRLVSNGEGELFDISYQGPNRWLVRISVMVVL